MKAASKKLASARNRLLGVVGRLLTSPEFLIETEALKKESEKLAAADRPSWPLQRPVRVASPPVESREAGPEIVDFVGHLKVHLDRWGLMKLVDWDLPEPQGPLFDDQLPLAAPASPTHGVRITLPLHYPLQGDDDLLRQIKEYQQQAMKDQGLPTHLAAIGNHDQFAQFFRLIRVETTLRSRWAEKAPPHAVGLIESAAAKVLKRTPDTIHRMRKRIATLRSGKRKVLSKGRG